MMRLSRIGILSFAVAVAIGMLAGTAQAGTIIKLNLGGDNSTDISYDGNNLSTLNDGGLNPGDQDTAVDFLDILSPIADIPSPNASFSLNGLARVRFRHAHQWTRNSEFYWRYAEAVWTWSRV